MVKPYKHNAAHLEEDLLWLKEIITQRYILHTEAGVKKMDVDKLKAPAHSVDDSVYKQIINGFKFTNAERIVLLLALVPHIKPYFLDDVIASLTERSSASFMPAKNGTVPTIDLCLFILAGDDLEKRFFYSQIFEPNSFFSKNSIIIIERDTSHTFILQQPIKISAEYLSLLTVGKPYKPAFSNSFPAKRVETELEWKDLVLNANTQEHVNEIKAWIVHSKKVLQDWDLGKRLAPGYKVLFYGKPGTGKTFTASLIGKETGLDVYKIDLAMVISKYIGETQQNLARIFDEASNKEWILFFDEADALFGKRSELKDSHDRYANQEVAFLLQRIEDHNGVVILSSNLRSNVDEAFTRRFQNIIHFPMPSPEERYLIWHQSFSKEISFSKDVDLHKIAQQYELSGGAIMNVIRYASLKTAEKNKNIIQLNDIVKGIMREYSKEGRTV